MCQLLQKSLKIIKEQKSSEWEVVSDNDMHAKCSKVYYTHLIQKGMLELFKKHVKHQAEWKSWYELIIDIVDVTDVCKWELLMEFEKKNTKKIVCVPQKAWMCYSNSSRRYSLIWGSDDGAAECRLTALNLP